MKLALKNALENKSVLQFYPQPNSNSHKTFIYKHLLNPMRNINQIAKRVNETSNIYAADLADIQARLDEIWVQQKEILRRLINVLDAF